MTYYRIQAILEYLHRVKRFVTPNEVATELGMGWATAKEDLKYLANNEQIIERQAGRNKFVYRFKPN